MFIVHSYSTCNKSLYSYKRVNQQLCLFCKVEQYHRIAIIGCGIAGVSLCYYLCRLSADLEKSCHITVFDPYRPGNGGASRVAAGLLHPFSPNSKLLWKGQEAFSSATQLIRLVENELSSKLVQNNGIIRLALTQKQHRRLQQASISLPHVVQLFEDKDLYHVLGWNSSAISGLLLKDAYTIKTTEYLDGLWNLCMQFGIVEWRPETVTHLQTFKQTKEFEDVVICAGADTNFIEGLSEQVPITRSFGRNLYYRWNGTMTNILKMPIICGKYLIPDENRMLFTAGATFEREPGTSGQLSEDSEIANIHSRLDKLVPGILNHVECIHIDGAFRALPERTQLGSIPIVDLAGKFKECNMWLYTGLGSRGILYHAWLSQQLAKAIVFNDANILPKQVRRYHPNLAELDRTCKEYSTI
ncbi:hypothetical protein GpartN1_g3620.t1 [Galdieria partita]|uniref:FAD dependent oxidoreductase domain-containing protein n=1 Tax=Galdieria partita TaxID=83374 RepID=A0A9C7UQC6_9RHOD|nr:hypothetical protein GpartN1_g3620.t1 [Galdieria partita]